MLRPQPKALEHLREIMCRDHVWSFLPYAKQTVDISHNILLYIEDLVINFDGFKALNHLNLYVKSGELRCLIGANGAGKTTLMDVITGKIQATHGKIFFGQNIDLTTKREPEISRLGIGRKFQKPSAFEALSVMDNLRLAISGKETILHALFAKTSPIEYHKIDAILTKIDLQQQRHRLAGTLSHGQKQWLEIGMLLAADPKLLLIDEPVAGMTPQETERTAALLSDLAGKHTIIVVEHDMAFVRSIASTVTVLHQGAVLAEGSMSDIQNHPEVISAYLGE